MLIMNGQGIITLFAKLRYVMHRIGQRRSSLGVRIQKWEEDICVKMHGEDGNRSEGNE